MVKRMVVTIVIKDSDSAEQIADRFHTYFAGVGKFVRAREVLSPLWVQDVSAGTGQDGHVTELARDR